MDREKACFEAMSKCWKYYKKRNMAAIAIAPDEKPAYHAGFYDGWKESEMSEAETQGALSEAIYQRDGYKARLEKVERELGSLADTYNYDSGQWAQRVRELELEIEELKGGKP